MNTNNLINLILPFSALIFWIFRAKKLPKEKTPFTRNVNLAGFILIGLWVIGTVIWAIFGA
jgi:hypothetical protein